MVNIGSKDENKSRILNTCCNGGDNMTITKGFGVPLPYFTVDASLSRECVLLITSYLDLLANDAKASDNDVFLKSIRYFFNRWPDNSKEVYNYYLYVDDIYIDDIAARRNINRTMADSYIIGKECMKRFDNLVKQVMAIIENES